MAVFWVVVPCSLVEVYRRFRGACFHHQQGKRPDDGGSKHLRNESKLLPDYTVQQPRRQPYSHSSRLFIITMQIDSTGTNLMKLINKGEHLQENMKTAYSATHCSEVLQNQGYLHYHYQAQELQYVRTTLHYTFCYGYCS
jgi:hypothetical protein